MHQEEGSAKILVRGRNNNAKIDIRLILAYRVFVLLARAAVNHDCVPLPKFPKAINPKCLFRGKSYFFIVACVI